MSENEIRGNRENVARLANAMPDGAVGRRRPGTPIFRAAAWESGAGSDPAAESGAGDIPASAFNEGDEGEPLSPEVEAPDPKVQQQQILDDVKRGRAEFGDGFGEWAEIIRRDFPDAFTDTGKPRFTEMTLDTLTALAARIRADVGEPKP